MDVTSDDVMDAGRPAGPRRRPNRRQVLGAAAAAGAGAGVLRLLGAGDSQLASLQALGAGRDSTGGRLDWVSPLDQEQAQISHLLRRATFGADSAELAAATSAGYSATVERLLQTPADPPPPMPGGDPTGPLNLGQLQLWWLEHMLNSATPFIERMTLFWHGHFTSDYQKVGVQTPFLHWQNLTWRDMALGDLGTMLSRVTVDPAMLRYLDLGTSIGAAPNENYARELMELFALGVGHYSEDDVRAMAKALAGWVEPRPTGSVQVTLDKANQVVRRLPTYAQPSTGVFVPRRAYRGPAYQLLGKTDSWTTPKALAQVLAQSSTAGLIAGKVVQSFVGVNAAPAYVARLADGFRASGYDVKELMRAVFMSPEFLAPASYRALVKSPTEFMVNALKAVGARNLGQLAAQSAANMGQALFAPPDVGGWPHNDAWISSNNVITRVNFVSQLLGRVRQLPPASDIARHLDSTVSPATASALDAAGDDQTRWFVALASPEFQLK
ncbi:MAG TPA: DUF1800 domain-containing protein [Candidatus Nitrosotalea sp.]|nr:DUF1800 domain-containing protein [Candidatus Nitrosotalea sp.]